MRLRPRLHTHRKSIEWKLYWRIRAYMLIGTVIALFVASELYINAVSIFYVFFGGALGTGIGFFLTRTQKLSWQAEKARIIGQMDVLGGCILVLNIMFTIFRGWIFEHFATGSGLSVFLLSMTAGTMYGRVLLMRRTIFNLLGQQ